MSWSFTSTTDHPDGVTAADIPALEDSAAAAQTSPEGCDEAYAEQLATAKRVAADLATVCGDSGRVHVHLSGHANPEHAPGGNGWADEMIAVTVHAAS